MVEDKKQCQDSFLDPPVLKDEPGGFLNPLDKSLILEWEKPTWDFRVLNPKRRIKFIRKLND